MRSLLAKKKKNAFESKGCNTQNKRKSAEMRKDVPLRKEDYSHTYMHMFVRLIAVVLVDFVLGR